jgi:HD-GYP domain-containing protein (c-di-GMP phosphodiesterase class II)
MQGAVIFNRAHRFAMAAAAVLALAAALTHMWWLAAIAAGVAGAAALVSGRVRPSLPVRDGQVRSIAVQPAVSVTVEPHDVVHVLLRAASEVTAAVSAHLWLRDPATATYRLVAAAGSMRPSAQPLPLDDPSVRAVTATGGSSLEPVVRLSHGSDADTGTLWRFAFPIVGGTAEGLAAVDVESAERPSAQALESAVLGVHGALFTALALHVARAEALQAANLLEAAHELSRRLRPEEVAERALERAMAISGAASGSVMLAEQDRGLTIQTSRGIPDDVVASTAVAPGEGIAGWVFSSGKPLLVEDLPGGDGTRRRGVRSAVSVPIADEDGILGVLNVGSREFPARFTDDNLRALETLGRLTAVALRNANAMQSASELYFATLTALAVALETKDPYARGATGRVVGTVAAIADHMRVSDVDRQALNIAALLHDIGMGMAGGPIGGTARPLSTAERGMLKAHPVVAAEVLADVPALRAVVPIVYHHHEWYDGHGYVGGLAGEAIPQGSRILAVADAFVAMTSERPYRRAMTVGDALEELSEKAGTQFDPDVVAALRRALDARPDLAAAPHPAS